MPEVTAAIVDYSLGIKWDDLPHAVRQHAVLGVTNIVGCMLGAADHPSTRQIDNALSRFSGPQTSVLVGRSEKRDPLSACLVNGVGANARTFDDTHAEAVIHPSAPVAAALLAAASIRPISGADYLLAYYIGVEISCRLSRAISVVPGESYAGWSQSAICTGIASALSVARALALDETAACTAVTIAASQAAGLRAVQGTTASSLMYGHSAQCGLRAAILAAEGATGTHNVLEARNGFLEAFSDKFDVDALTGAMGDRHEILKNLYKPYPCGIVIHPVIDACLALKQRTGLEGAAIRSITLTVSPVVLALTDRRHPATPLAAQVSVYHWAAVCLQTGVAGLTTCDASFLDAPEIHRLRDVLTLRRYDSMPAHATLLEVETISGEHLIQQVDWATGTLHKPMDERQISRKFLDQAAIAQDERRSYETLEALLRLPDIDDVGLFTEEYLAARSQ
ncbi:MmgE/PrpD family protein [Sinorhizobium medicae]|uniref:MmgE/PrpD family protein n=1 Tax=Sinorhizobium medicae TaxID=110321 RepID=UPI000FD7239D|nr:MmgE/PrpD family protein [Sinorhizobium medicae]RVO73521.1 MmgE/PrpD family protein [Sinorhizobium medicae]